MKQLVLNFATGDVKLIDVPPPLKKYGGVIVKNKASVVSLGTESQMISFAKKNTVSKALSRPDLLKQVLDFAKSEGYLEAYRQAKHRLDAYEPLGYSSAGIVMEVGEEIADLKEGDKVACFGSGYASHSEIIFVPRRLCVKIPSHVPFEEAAFAGVGAISLHSVRLAETTLGDNVAVIGSGLLGQIAVQLLKNSGCNVFAIDISEYKVNLARELGADDGGVLGKESVVDKAMGFTNNIGFDAVLIFAATKSNEPLELAAEIVKTNGKIVAPGLVGLKIPRSLFYEKEISFIVPRSFGPGIYDPTYEHKGIDYPIQYVKWTAQRNVNAFLKLLEKNKINLKPLITHKFKFDKAEEVYNSILNKELKGPIGILFTYDDEPSREVTIFLRGSKKKDYKKLKTINVGVIGAGGFVRGTILPIIKKIPYISLVGIASTTGNSARIVAEKYKFKYFTTDYHKILDNSNIDVVIIATHHDTHAKFVVEALKAEKDVFVEKPLSINIKQLQEVVKAYNKSDNRLMVGFNRRFSPFSIYAKKFIKTGKDPLIMNMRVNAGYLPAEHWVHDPIKGGGRIIGEVCHFVDLSIYFAESQPRQIYAESPMSIAGYLPDDNVIATIKFDNSSISTISYVSNGDKAFSRERIELFGNKGVCVIKNFRSLLCMRDGKTFRMKKWFSIDRGHTNEFHIFFESIKNGKGIPVDFKEYLYTTLVTFKLEDSLKKGQSISINLEEVLSGDFK